MPDISKRLEKAEKNLQRGRLDLALDEYLAALREDPGNDRVREAAADLCISLNRDRQAEQLCSALFDNAAAAGDSAKAIATYRKLARVGTPEPEQTFRFAQFLERTSKREAIEAYESTVRDYIITGRKQEAFTSLQRLVALEAAPDNLRRAGELAAELGYNEDAARAFLQLGELEQAGGGRALPWCERAHALDPNNAAAALAYGRAVLAQGDAKGAIKAVGPFASGATNLDAREIYGRALIAAQRLAEALPYSWELFERDPREIVDIIRILESMLEAGQWPEAIELARKIEDHEVKAGRRREYVSLIKDVADKHSAAPQFLEYLVEVFNAANREHDYCEMLLKLFQLYYAAGNFLKAGDCLDRAAEVDAYEPGHQKRLEMLRGKIDANRFNGIAGRLAAVLNNAEQKEHTPEAAFSKEGTVLEDLMLQAEIFLQYSMRSRAVERLERIVKLFPGEEVKNQKLRQLFLSAGFTPASGVAVPQPAGRASARPAPAPAPREAAPPAPQVPQAVADEAAVDNIARVTEITQNIYRQGSVKGVLFAAVNDIGRHWNASRCVAGLCTPGKPPSAALEYCGPGVQASDVMAVVKLIMTLGDMATQRGPIVVPNAVAAPELARVQPVMLSLGINALVAVPLVDGEENIGLLMLQQCGAARAWRQTDVIVLKTIADQMVLAVNNAKLRSLVKTLAVTEKSGLLKRSSYVDVLLSEVKRALPQNSSMTVMLLHFGKASALVREVGEQVVQSTMQEIGQAVCSHLRQNDIVVRYDLTTIALVLSDTTEKNAFFVVDKLRKVLAGVRVAGRNKRLPMTVGIAEAVMQQRFDAADIVTEVINRAEAALDAAKAEGGNKAQSLAPALEAAAGSATSD